MESGGREEGDMFEMDDLDEEMSPAERQRRRDEAAAKAWDCALAASSAAAAVDEQAPTGGKGKKGRKAGQVLLAWG